MNTSAQSAKVQKAITDESTSGLKKYQAIVVGSPSLVKLLRYELTMHLCSGMSGALGLILRKKLFKGLLGQCGRGAVFGQGVTLRYPGAIRVGDRFVAADGVILDGRGPEMEDGGITMGDDVLLGQRCIVQCKNGAMKLGSRIGVGAYCGLYAVGGNRLTIGDDVAIGHYCYFGGTGYHHDRLDIPISQQGHDLKGGITIGDGCWFGARVTVIDGVTIGKHCIIGAGAVVTRDVPDYAVVAGIPAKVLRMRTEHEPPMNADERR